MKKGYVRLCRGFTKVALYAFVSTATLSCGSDREPEQVQDPTPQTMGSLGLALTGTARSGNVYRLRDGVFSILGESTGYYTTVSTETNPDLPSIEVQVPADTYSVFLNPGYRLERIDESGGSFSDYGRLAKRNPALRSSLFITPDGRVGLNGREQAEGRIQASDPRLPGVAVPITEIVVRPPTAPTVVPPPDPDDSTDVPVTTDVTSTTDSPVIDAGVPETSGEVDGGTELEYALVSENPAFAEVHPFGTAFVSFRFMVGEGVVDMQPGVISIGIEVEEVDGSCSDAFEPNDTSEQAASIATDEPISAIACGYNEDWYRFAAPVPEGEPFAVNIAFSHAQGDIDAILFDEEGFYVSDGSSGTDDETLVATSNGGSYILLVYSFDGRTNPYTVDIVEDVDDLRSNCCEASPFPGCVDDAVTSCVCEIDPYCCEYGYDEACVSLGLTECQAQCEGQGDCCEVTDAPGCQQPEIQACACAADPQCCASGFDEVCIRQAETECGLQCEVTEPTSDCCEATDEPGCTVSAVEACVCDLDPMCCTTSFDENCANLAAASCGASCELPSDGQSCCETSAAGGCADAEVAECVCEVDSFCCDVEYDDTCIAIADSMCAAQCGGSASPADAGAPNEPDAGSSVTTDDVGTMGADDDSVDEEATL